MTTTTGENRFVFVAPMYDASEHVGQMLHSIVGQSYSNWKIIFIDDVSSIEHRTRSAKLIQRFSSFHDDARITVRWNDEKRWEVANVLWGLELCSDDDIVCRIDADDWLTDLDALAIIDAAYKQLDADCLWTAHRWGFSDRNISGPLPADADPYRHPWVSSHLKTFRKRLLRDVNDANFRGADGGYVRRAGDQAIYLPVLRNARRRVYLPRVMYHYHIIDVPETYQTDDARFQRDEALFLRARGYVK